MCRKGKGKKGINDYGTKISYNHLQNYALHLP